MTHLIMIRHGETDWNINRRFQGMTDTPLNESGRAQAALLGIALADLAFDVCYSSDLVRVVETAEIALGARAHQIQRELRLREISFGKFEGLTYEEIQATYPDELAVWEADRNQAAHGGERIADVIARVQAIYDALREKHPKQRVLLFGHGGTLGILLSLALGAPPEKWWQFRLHNTALTEMTLYDEGAILSRYNDIAHLRQGVMRGG